MPTPEASGEPFEREVLEPIVVLRPRRTDALADLFRELTELSDAPGQDKTRTYEAVDLTPPAQEDDTQYIPPLPPNPPAPPKPSAKPWPSARPGPVRAAGHGIRRAAAITAVCAAAVMGFAAALLLPGRESDAAVQLPQTPPVATADPTPSASAPQASADPDGEGTLREGDSGPEVVDLQQRLRKIPNVYDDGSTAGTYDATLKEAVARFQLWYGIRGDENGVYGDDTRRDLESRTS